MSYNILYKGRKIYHNLSQDQAMDILEDMAKEYYNNEVYDPYEIELEEIPE